MATLRINLPEDLKALAETRAADEGHPSLDAYVQSLIRADAEIDAELEALLNRRLDSPAIEATPQFWAELKAQVREQRRKKAAP